MSTVSIVLTSYNYARYLDAAIGSVLAQSWDDWELIIVDDGSTDESVERITEWASRDTRIRLLRHPDGGNHGLSASLHLGVHEARAPLVAFLESDDAWREDCLERRLQAFSRYNPDVVFNTVEPVSMDGYDVEHIRRYLKNLRLRFSSPGPVSLGQGIWLANIIPSFSCAMVRRSLLDCNMQAPEPAWLDWWMWFQLAAHAAFVYLDTPLTRWRVHEGSYSASITGLSVRKKRMISTWWALAPERRPIWLGPALLLPAPTLDLLRVTMLLGLRLRRVLM